MLFDSDDDLLQFAGLYGLDLARATLLKERSEYADAAYLYLENDRASEAVRLTLRVPEDRRCADAVARHLTERFWAGAALGNLDCASTDFQEILPLALKLLEHPRFSGDPENAVCGTLSIVSLTPHLTQAIFLTAPTLPNPGYGLAAAAHTSWNPASAR